MLDKKIGILTQYYQRNYGGILQSYAMFQIVKSLGYDVEIIDFRYDASKNRSIKQFVKIIKGKLSGWFSISRNGQTKKCGPNKRKLPEEHLQAFKDFKAKYLKYSPILDNETLAQYAANYDAIIVGSDQVWNDLEGKRLFYFFDFSKPFNGRKIAYAPCSIITTVDRPTKHRLKRLLQGFDAISVRDETTKQLVSFSSGIIPKIVLDPTYLYAFKEFALDPIIKDDYIFSYILGSEISSGHQSVLNAIFEKYGKMKVVAAIIPNVSLEVEKFADEVRYNASPADWVNLLANARFVYTDSFHGCVFAMKFHKQFLAYYKDAQRSSRLLNLRTTYSLNNIVASCEKIVLPTVNYETLDSFLNKQRKDSMAFLSSSLL